MAKYVVGNVHGNYLGLKQALEQAPLQEGDTIIFLGDLVDGHYDSFKVIEYILGLETIYNVILIKGNHDVWFKEWLDTGINPVKWGMGQLATAISYMENVSIKEGYQKITEGYKVDLIIDHIPGTHISLFNRQLDYYKDEENNLFIHGGFNRHILLDQQPSYIFYWDRDLWSSAMSFKDRPIKNPFLKDENSESVRIKFKITEPVKEVFLGHTSTEFWNTDKPINAAQIWNLDTGGGWYGRVTIMNVDTKEFYQSNRSLELYPNFEGRK